MIIPYTVSLSTIYGQMLVNRHDINQTNALLRTGVGLDGQQIGLAQLICQNAGSGAIALDIGANFGMYSLSCARILAPLGGIIHAFEAQRMLAYMLCGSLSLNSIENVIVHVACVGNSHSEIDVPCFDYNRALNFGSIEFGQSQREPLDQERAPSIEKVQQIRIDDADYRNVGFVKIDVEGMEWDVLQGAMKTIARERPCVIVEYLKSDPAQLANFFSSLSYKIWILPPDLLCVPEEEVYKYQAVLPPIEQ